MTKLGEAHLDLFDADSRLSDGGAGVGNERRAVLEPRDERRREAVGGTGELDGLVFGHRLTGRPFDQNRPR